MDYGIVNFDVACYSEVCDESLDSETQHAMDSSFEAQHVMDSSFEAQHVMDSSFEAQHVMDSSLETQQYIDTSLDTSSSDHSYALFYDQESGEGAHNFGEHSYFSALTSETVPPVSHEEKQTDSVSPSPCEEKQSSSLPKKHHVGKVPVVFQTNKKYRCSSLVKRRKTLLKKAFEMNQISGVDVLCIVQNKDGDRWFYASGELREKFTSSEGVRSNDTDHEFNVIKDLPDEVVNEPTPTRLNATQTYLPATLQTLIPNISTPEQKTVEFTPPKQIITKQGRKAKKLFSTEKSTSETTKKMPKRKTKKQ